MALLSVIRRWYHRDQMSIREISRQTGLSRNTLRKYLRSEVVEPRFRTPDRPSKLDPYADRLSAWLRRELMDSHPKSLGIRQQVEALEEAMPDGPGIAVSSAGR